MWQRIQTVFLLIAIISLITTIFLPIWVFDDAAGKTHELYALHYSITEDGVKTTKYIPYCLTAVLLIAAATLAAIEIGKYKDRMMQIKLGALNSVFLAGGLGAGVYFASTMVKTFQGGLYGLGLWLPGIAVVCNWLAMRFIKRDEKLVRDSNRLR
jgi:hypothetical protein